MSLLPPEYNATELPLPPLPPPSPLSKTDFSSLNLPPDPHASEPTTPTTPLHPESSEGKQKRNPLTDLVESERVFVEQLTGIIRKVAAAWSRANLPPPELDTMFRSIEGIYRANRGLIAKLKVIDADPKSAGELGGLLIKWIDDLNDPYETYCSRYCCGFDIWEPVTSNPRLIKILAQFSESNPALTPGAPWTLDSLFLLPRTRLSYYLKLYKRLLKNTQNPLLLTAVETLNRLLDTFENRSSVRVGDGRQEANIILDALDEVVIDMRTQTLSPLAADSSALRPDDSKTGSDTSSAQGRGSGGERSSHETQNTSFSRGSSQTLSMPITDLEHRLSIERTLDIFTMVPKAVKLQISPPSLTFTREMRISCDAVIRFTPRATGVEVVHRGGHIFLLSDLFLICERMRPEERHSDGEGPDMWLCYPPLSGKVLRASEMDEQSNILQVAIMKKEFLTLETCSREERDRLLYHFKECIEFSASAPPPSKNPPPPLPPFNAHPRLQSDTTLPNNSRPPDAVGPLPPNNNSMSSPDKMPPSAHPNILHPNLPPSSPGPGPSAIPPSGATLPLGPVPLGPLPSPFSSVGPPPPLGIPRGQPPLRTSVSAQPLPFTPLRPQIPPARSTSFIPGGLDSNRPPLGPDYPIRGNTIPAPPFAPNLPPPGHPNARFPPSPYPPSPYPPGVLPYRPPSDPAMGPRPPQAPQGPIPPGFHPPNMPQMQRNNSFPNGPHFSGLPHPMLPSQAQREGPIPFNEPSPPNSPEVMQRDLGPVTSTISAQMKCKVFLQQQHAQWKSLGSAKLKLYRQDPTNVKQLVVEADNKDKSVLISTIVLTDGVERVGKTGVAIELSDKGTRTGIVYMIQLRNESSAGGLFDSLLAGSDRSR